MSPYAIANLCVVLELLVGELIFFYSYKKRKYFWVRFPVSVAVCLILTVFFPAFTLPAMLNRVIQLLVFFSYTIAVYVISFDLKFKVVLSLCSAGYALEHIIYQFSMLIHNMPFGEGYSAFIWEYHRIAELTVFVIAYVIYFFAIGKRIAKLRVDENFNIILNFFSVFVVLVCILLSLYSGNSNVAVYVSLYSIICCALALVLQFAVLRITQINREKESMRRKTEADMARYESAKDAINFINIKCHDLKKELTAIEEGAPLTGLDELRKTIEIYDCITSTGNGIIDTVMINATLRNAQHGVKFTFSGSGEWLNFVDDVDLKSIFINAVSNAAEAAITAPPDERNISVNLEKKGDMVVITVKNYYRGKPISSDRLPSTTKKNADEHGFGLKSIEIAAKKYGGAVSVSGTGEIFTLSLFLMEK